MERPVREDLGRREELGKVPLDTFDPRRVGFFGTSQPELDAGVHRASTDHDAEDYGRGALGRRALRLD
jgi:hypothetical protein